MQTEKLVSHLSLHVKGDSLDVEIAGLLVLSRLPFSLEVLLREHQPASAIYPCTCTHLGVLAVLAGETEVGDEVCGLFGFLEPVVVSQKPDPQ